MQYNSEVKVGGKPITVELVDTGMYHFSRRIGTVDVVLPVHVMAHLDLNSQSRRLGQASTLCVSRHPRVSDGFLRRQPRLV